MDKFDETYLEHTAVLILASTCIINITCLYMASWYCQYMFKILKNRSVEGIDGWIYNEMHISNINLICIKYKKKYKWKSMTGPEIRTQDPCITRKVF